MMRLHQTEIQAIKETILSLDENAEIYIFGSRTDQTLKGGDIDILVLSQSLSFGDKLKIKQMIFEKMEEQKIDLIIARDTSSPFVRMAFKKGVQIT
jgi:uncharacterized protein